MLHSPCVTRCKAFDIIYGGFGAGDNSQNFMTNTGLKNMLLAVSLLTPGLTGAQEFPTGPDPSEDRYVWHRRFLEGNRTEHHAQICWPSGRRGPLLCGSFEEVRSLVGSCRSWSLLVRLPVQFLRVLVQVQDQEVAG
jgi:hypothetical protein